MREFMAVVIIPAHDEEHRIGSCLDSVLMSADEDETSLETLEIIVVANGCKDRTANVVGEYLGRVRLIETDIPSKSNSLNLADEATQEWPRIYLDADVSLSRGSIRSLKRTLSEEGIFAAAPAMRVNLTGRPWSVRAFYNVWQRLPYVQIGLVGSGVFAVNEPGHKRFDRFPDTFADDNFVRMAFLPSERKVCSDCYFEIHAPRSLRALLRIKTRVHLANVDLADNHFNLTRSGPDRHGRSILRLLKSPVLWPAIAMYLFVRLWARLCAKILKMGRARRIWHRDETTRV